MFTDNENNIYNLQQLKKELLKLDLEKKNYITINKFYPLMGKIYGVFSNDNAFMFAKEKSCFKFNYEWSVLGILCYVFKILVGGSTIISKNYYLTDLFSKTIISDKYDETFIDGDTYEKNSIEYYVVTLSKIIPASFLTNISLENVRKIQDSINVFLGNNPNFINQVLFEMESSEQKETELNEPKKLTLSNNSENK